MITQFFDSDDESLHDEFQKWRTNHQRSSFLNMETITRAVLHGTRCQHFGSGPPYFTWANGWGSLTTNGKACGNERELVQWATKKGIEVRRCSSCVRDGLIGPVGHAADTRLAEEVPLGTTYAEGSVQRILVNRYERDARARERCIKFYQAVCVLCKFDFSTVYGDALDGFIHVHHLKPLSSIGAEYEVDPIRDLRPVCPNCHAVLHRREPPYSLDEVREFLNRCGS